MDWTQITIAILAALAGGGGLGAAFISWLADRDIKKADAYAKISDVYEQRLTALTTRSEKLEKRVECLEQIIAGLRLEVGERDDMIDILQRENVKLKAEVKKLQSEGKSKDAQIALLQSQVADLNDRLDRMNNKDSGG